MGKKDGGPAYPSIYEQQGGNDSGSAVFFSNPGMSLRDYFAGQAMVGLLAGATNAYWQDDALLRRLMIANEAKQLADGMLAELQEGSEG